VVGGGGGERRGENLENAAVAEVEAGELGGRVVGMAEGFNYDDGAGGLLECEG
jgi:hypothetical protein